MKVISGLYKGRKIEGYDISGTRPTMDRVKESLFATIQNYLPNSIVLDLFAGSGALGIEALSEGAKFAYFVDSNPRAIKTIMTTIQNFNIPNASCHEQDYLNALINLQKENITFDLIFLDPPYKTSFIEKSLNKIMELSLLSKDGIIVCESDNLNKIVYPPTLHALKEKKYGDKFVVILKQM